MQADEIFSIFDSYFSGSFSFHEVHEESRTRRQLTHSKSTNIRDSRSKKLEICWHEQREVGSCRLGEACGFAHSDLELEVWILLRSSNMSAQQLVQFSDSGTIVQVISIVFHLRIFHEILFR